VGGVFIWGREKGSVEAERDTARGDELEIIFQRAEAIPYFFNGKNKAFGFGRDMIPWSSSQLIRDMIFNCYGLG